MIHAFLHYALVPFLWKQCLLEPSINELRGTTGNVNLYTHRVLKRKQCVKMYVRIQIRTRGTNPVPFLGYTGLAYNVLLCKIQRQVFGNGKYNILY